MPNITKTDIAGLTADEQLELIGEKTHELVNLQYSTYNRSLLPALRQNGTAASSASMRSCRRQHGAFVDQVSSRRMFIRC